MRKISKQAYSFFIHFFDFFLLHLFVTNIVFKLVSDIEVVDNTIIDYADSHNI